MSESSDSEEFYDAEEFTPNKNSKHSSVSKNSSIKEAYKDRDREKSSSMKTDNSVASTSKQGQSADTQPTLDDDLPSVKNVVQDRRRFQELRRCMQTEEDDDMPEPSGSVDQHNFNMEQPFKIISHDAMSLQSMTSLGRIGRILSGAAESHPNILEHSNAAPSASSREPSTQSDDPLPTERVQNVLTTVEPDVMASTKANSLKSGRGSTVATVASTSNTMQPPSQPVAPPRRKKRNKLHGSQSLSTTDGDNLSICTNDTDDYCMNQRKVERPEKPQALENLNEANASSLNQSMALPSPASTIESLTREFQDSLQLSQVKYESRASTERVSSASSKSSTANSTRSHRTRMGNDDKDDLIGRADRLSNRTHSDSRPSHSRVSESDCPDLSRRVSAGEDARRRGSARLTDMEILEQVTLLNLDTGELMPLSKADTKIPQCINPLSLHIMRLTSEYLPNDDENQRETDEESESVYTGAGEDDTKEPEKQADKQTGASIKRKTEKIKRFFGTTVKKTVDAAKSLAQEVTHARHKEDVGDIPDDVRGEHNIKLKASNSHKGPYDFDGCVRHVQEMDAHSGAVWCCKFSVCGRLLATAGQDKLLRVWVTRDAHSTMHDMRMKYEAKKKSSPTPSQESLVSIPAPPPSPEETPLGPSAPFSPKPFAVYYGHTSDLLDVSWSKNYFLLSSSMDKTVRLWHVSRAECLCCFQHIDFVTAIVFHPRDDRYFLSGSLDGKLRLWDIPDKKVAVWNEVDGKTKLITAANFCQNGKFAVVGTYDGRCIFYTTDQLKYHTQIDVRSARGKNSTGRKISGIEPMHNDDKILITSNDSRIRLYDLRDLSVSCKYKGYVNMSSQIKASFSHDGKYIVSGSENQCIYIWKTCHDYSKFTSVRRDRNDFWEGIKAHNAVVTCAVFAPNPDHMIRMITQREEEAKMAKDGSEVVDEVKGAEGGMVSSSQTGHVLVSADFNGCIKVFVHKAKPKHSSLPASALA